MSWPEEPMVSALMVVTRPALIEMARKAAECFLDQDWEPKELLILNTTDDPVLLFRSAMREYQMRCQSYETALAILRDNAHGEWCVTWDQDCWYAPNVLSTHMANRDPQTTVLFKNKTCYALRNRQDVVISDNRVVHASFFRNGARFHSGTQFWKQTPALKVVDNDPGMVVKFVRAF